MTYLEHAVPSVGSFADTLRSVMENLRTESAAAHRLDELYTDPETLKRTGAMIAVAARRAVSAKY
jgi:hypothetical protein